MAKKLKFSRDDSESILEIKIKEYGIVIFKSKCRLRDKRQLSAIFHILKDKFNIVIPEKEDKWFE